MTQVTLPDNIKQFQWCKKRLVGTVRFGEEGMSLEDYYEKKNSEFYALHSICPYGIEIGKDWKMPNEKDTKGFWFIEDNVIGFQLEADRTWYMMKNGKTD